MRGLVVGALLLLSSACRFDDSAPATALIQCESSDQCPVGWRCSLLRGVCLTRSETDTVGPTLTAEVTPTLVRPGDAVTVTVTSDEPLSGSAVVEVRAGAVLRPVEPSAAGPFVFQVPATEADGLLTFYGKAEDVVGNGTQGVMLGTAVVDGTAPQVLAVRLTPPTVAPTGAATVLVTMSEDVRAGAQLVVTGANGAEVTRVDVTTPTGALRLDFTVPPGTADQRLSLQLINVVDLVGNPGVDTPLGAITVDGTAPTVGPLSLSGRRFSAQPNFNALTVPVTVGNATFVDVCVGNDCRDGAGTSSVVFPVTAGVDGPRLVSVRARDDVGNTAEATDLVTFDFTPPQVQSAQVRPALAAPGTNVAVTVSFDEILRAGAQLEVFAADGGLVTRIAAVGATDRVATFDLTVPPLPSQTLSLVVSNLADVVDNTAPPLGAGTLLVDDDAPTVQPLGLVGRRFSDQPGFDQMRVPVVVAGASRAQACISGACVDATDAGQVTFTVRADAGEGSKTVSVRAWDDVGHLTEVAESVVFDFTAPRLQDLEVTPDAVAPGGTVAVTASFDEVLGLGPTLEVTSSDGGWRDRFYSTQRNSPVASFVVRLPPTSLPSDTFTMRMSAVADEVANSPGVLDSGTFVLDADPPLFLPSDAGFPHRYSRQPGFDTVVVRAPPVSGATRVEICLEANCRDSDGGWAAFRLLPGDTEGNHPLVMRAIDAVGNSTVLFDAVTYDFTSPSLVFSDLQYSPPPGCPLTAVTAATTGSGISLQTTFDEDVALIPSLDAGVIRFTLGSGNKGDRAFVFNATAPSAVGNDAGLTAIYGEVTDDVGNRAVVFMGQVAVDLTPPSALSPTQQEGFVYTRNPYQLSGTTPAPQFTVRADAGVFEPGVLVQLWSDSFTTGALQVATLRATDAGGLAPTPLPPVDYPKLYFRTYDSACNGYPVIGTQTAPVPRMEWTVSMAGKVLGQTAPNPNRFFEEYSVTRFEVGEGSTREWATELWRAGDDAGATSSGPSLRWQLLRPELSGVKCVVRDNLSGGLLVVGDRTVRQGTTGWLDLGPTPPTMRGNCAAVWDGTNYSATVVMGWNGSGIQRFGDETWSVTGTAAWGAEGFFTGNSSLGNFIVFPAEGVVRFFAPTAPLTINALSLTAGLPTRPLAPANFTQFNGRPFVVGSISGAPETWALEGDPLGVIGWVQKPNAPMAPAAMAELEGSGAKVVLVGVTGGQAFEWDGSGWKAIAACPIGSSLLGAAATLSGATFVGTDYSIATWNGTSWRVDRPGAPRTNGWRALGHTASLGSLATDLNGRTVVFHAQLSDGGVDSTWLFTDAGWTLAAGATPATSTGVLTTDADGGVLMVGLSAASTMTTWQWRNGAWSTLNSGTPSRRSSHGLAIDSRGFPVLMGGIVADAGMYLSDAYLFNGSSWAPMSTPGGFAQRARQGLAFDPVRRVTVMYGGESGLAMGDVYELSAGTWSLRPMPAPTPPARSSPGLVWDHETLQLVMHGGTGFGDTWVFDGTWRDRTKWSGRPAGPGPLAWDPYTRSVMSVSEQGESFLMPDQQVAHRFLPFNSVPAGTVVQSGRLVTNVNATRPGDLVCSVYRSGWNGVGAVNAVIGLGAADTTAALRDGVRIWPQSLAGNRFTTDYVELTVRYVVNN